MSYLFLLVSIVFAVVNSVLFHKREALKNKMNPFMFNGVGSVVWIAVLVLANNGKLCLNTNTVLYGIIYGAVQILFLFFKLKAMETGPVSVTTLIGNCSMIFSVVVSMIIWNEPVGILQWVGIAILLAGIAIASEIRKSDEYKPLWSLYAVGFFVLAGIVGIVFKLFSSAENHQHYTDMFIIAAVFMSVCNFLISSRYAKKGKHAYDKADWRYALLCGVVCCAYNRLNAFLAGALPGVIFFPVFNGSVIILSAVAGVVICKEKLKKMQLLGFAMGAVALLFIGKVIV
ncbi:MAG: DMT family transporter [Clostridiales bacterium]|nr:DMT family transporter [Clostridiales bacterium]